MTNTLTISPTPGNTANNSILINIRENRARVAVVEIFNRLESELSLTPGSIRIQGGSLAIPAEDAVPPKSVTSLIFAIDDIGKIDGGFRYSGTSGFFEIKFSHSESEERAIDIKSTETSSLSASVSTNLPIKAEFITAYTCSLKVG
ncbi:hypothetical protein [Streptomyces vinaceus]|uniref:hypothetical protein n=1 Tax=Streptomyces vinaceus TaxID=1960 RepID=UPI00369ABD78